MTIEKREFSADQRHHLADTGAAMPDGSFPIANGQDLKNAIQAIGRAKDRAAAMAHIRTRARALGMSDMLPDSWSKARATEFDIPCKARAGEHGVVHGWSIVSAVEGQPYVDFHGDWIPEDAMYEAALDFATKSRAMKVQHAGPVAGEVPFILPLTADVKKELSLDGPYAGLAVGLKPVDKAVLDGFRSGAFTGLSIGGRRVTDEVVKRSDGALLGTIDVASIGVALGKDASPEAVDAMYEHELELIAKAAKLERNQLRRVMRKFVITEISPVDEPAQEPALARLIKHRPIVSTEDRDTFSIEKVAFTPALTESGREEHSPMDANAQQLATEIETLKAKMARMITPEERDRLSSEIADLKKQLARTTKALSLPADESAHYAWLADDVERDAFLGKTREARQSEMTAAIVYTAQDGTVYRKGEERFAELTKKLDEQGKELTKATVVNHDAEIAKAARETMSHLPEAAAHAALLKAARSIPDEAQRAAAVKLLQTADAAYATLFKNLGRTGPIDPGGASPEAKIEAAIKKQREIDPKLTREQALDKALVANPALYDEYNKARSAPQA